MMNWMRVTLAAVMVVVAVGVIGPTGRAGEFVWLEGEAGKANVKVNNAGWDNAQFLSEGRWMRISLDADKVEAEVKADAVVIQYPFEIKKAGRYEVWNRIGFEFARSPFEYRIDEGAWTKINPDDLTTDLMEIAFFCEVAWLKMGDVQPAPGEHALGIRVTKTKDKDGKMQRILYAGDVPMPTQSWRQAQRVGRRPDAPGELGSLRAELQTGGRQRLDHDRR
jgi:hypothetical protein